jgi:ribosome-associated protein
VPDDAEAGQLRVTSSLTIPVAELEWRFSGSGGPGGQHANTANTRVELRFDVSASPSLTDTQRARLLERIGRRVRVVVDDERSQARNRTLALERLRNRLADALWVPTPRHPTRPSRAAKERRLEAKRRQAERKGRRRLEPGDDG